MIRKLLLLLSAILLVTVANAQKTDTQKLRDFALQLRLRYAVEHAKALELATKTDMPVKSINGESQTELSIFVNGFPRIFTTYNLVAAATASTSPCWPGGSAGLNLTGTGVQLAIWDGGKVLTTHQEYSGRVTLGDVASLGGHATHVAGTMIASGVDANAKGMSPDAMLVSYDWNDDAAEMATEGANGLKVSNHSYGYLTGWNYNYRGDSKWVWFGDTTLSRTKDYGFGAYESTSHLWDTIAYAAPDYLIVKSSGNERFEGPTTQPVAHWLWNGGDWVLSSSVREKDGGTAGYDCLPWQSSAKNILTVGAVNDIPAGYQQPSDVVLAGFSSCGPTDDGRVKPDIVANGVGLYSSYSTSNTSYTIMSGTSMSTPNTSGSLGLLHQHHFNLTGTTDFRSSSVKGLILHTASEAGSNPGPDYQFGWGLLNTEKAALLMSEDAANGFNFNIREITVNQGDVITIPVYTKGTEPLLATLCWTDPPSDVYGQTVDDRTPMLVNDLDIRLINSNGTVYYPWKLDPDNPSAAATQTDNAIDNVEKVETGTPAAGETWFVQISHKGTLKAGLPQVASFIISGIVPPPTETTWTGTTDTDWQTAANWSNGIPGTSTNVTIAVATNMPDIVSPAFCNNITVENGTSVIGNGDLNVYGTATVECAITAARYHYVCSPVNGPTAGSVFPLTAFLRYYDETQPAEQWVSIYQNDAMLTTRGYALYVPAETGDITATYSGTMNDGPYTATGLSFTANSIPAYDGYNLTGNPYPSPIDLESAGIVRTNLDASVYFWDPSLNGGLGSYATWTIGSTGTNGATQYVPVGQGFFVKVSAEGLTGSFGLDNSTRTASTHAFYKSDPMPNTLRIKAGNDVLSDETVIRFAQGTSPYFDAQADAWKLLNTGTNQLYTRAADNGKLALNCFEGPGSFPVVPLNYFVATPGKFTITAAGAETFGEETPVVLLDTKTNIRQNLKANPAYTFDAATGDNEERFAIAFGALGTQSPEEAGISVYAVNQTLYIFANRPITQTKAEIIDASGKQIHELYLNGQQNVSLPLKVSPGMYIVRLVGNDTATSFKVVVW